MCLFLDCFDQNLMFPCCRAKLMLRGRGLGADVVHAHMLSAVNHALLPREEGTCDLNVRRLRGLE